MKSPFFTILILASILQFTRQGCGNCFNCTSNHCDLCDPGYVWLLKGDDIASCYRCDIQYPNCTLCSQNSEECRQCKPNNKLINGKCIYCGPKCLDCDSTMNCTAYENKFWLQDAICHQCGNDCQKCLNSTFCITCKPGGPNSFGSCQPCQFDNCTNCNTNNSFCQQCQIGGPDDDGLCVSCLDKNCYRCQRNDNHICFKCKGRFGLYQEQCYQCQENCNICKFSDSSSSVCQSCIQGWGLTNQTICEPCQVNRCVLCGQNSSHCHYCSDIYGVDKVKMECVKCKDTNCIFCPYDINFCFGCKEGFGINFPNRTCSLCQSGCLNCKQNYLNCTVCNHTKQIGLFKNSLLLFKCINCLQSNCYNCSLNSQRCVNCKTNFALNVADFKCGECSNNCSTCQTSNNQNCTSCNDSYYLSDLFTCQVCMDNCDICYSQHICTNCSLFYYWHLYQLQCKTCPPYCITCIHDPYKTIVNCTSCESGFQLKLNENPINCGDICGDFIVVFLQCDNDNQVNYDGCDFQCELQIGFKCKTQNNRSTCSYTKKIQMNITKITQADDSNTIYVTIAVFPPLHVFSTSNLLSDFLMTHQSTKILSITFNQQKSELLFTISYSADIFNQDLQFIFFPTSDQRYYASVNSSAKIMVQTLYYNPQFGFIAGPIVNVVSYLIMSLSWVNVVLGFGLKKLGGIELMMVIQILWSSIIWMDSYLYPMFEKAMPLKYAVDYDINMFKSSNDKRVLTEIQTFKSDQSLTYPHTQPFQLDTSTFGNNYNISLILQIISLFIFFISTGVLNHFRSNKKKLMHQSNDFYDEYGNQEILEINAKISQANQIQQICAHILFTLLILNLSSFTNAISIYFYNFNSISNWSNIGIIIIASLVFLATMISFTYDPDPFGHFRYSFRKNILSLNHYYFYIVYMISVFLFLAFLPKLYWLPLIPPGIVLLIIIISRPYNRKRENIRAFICLTTVLVILGMRVLIIIGPSPLYTHYYFCAVISLVFILTLITLCGLIYEFVWICYLYKRAPKTEQQKMVDEIDVEQIRYKMKQFKDKDTIFKNILRPQMNILDFSNKISQMALTANLTQDNKMFEQRQRFNNPTEIKHINTPCKQSMDSGRKLRKLMQTQRIQNKISPQQQPLICDYNLIESRQEERAEQNIQQNLATYMNSKRPDQNQNDSLNERTKQQKKEDERKLLALNFLVQQNKFLGLKNAEQVTNYLKEGQDKNNEHYMNAYQDIQ